MTHLQTNSVATSDIQVMEIELNELRHHFEWKVEQRTAQLVRRIALLESCNSTLCDKLELVQRELTTLKQQYAVQAIQPDPATQAIPIKQPKKLAGANSFARTANCVRINSYLQAG